MGKTTKKQIFYVRNKYNRIPVYSLFIEKLVLLYYTQFCIFYFHSTQNLYKHLLIFIFFIDMLFDLIATKSKYIIK